MKISMTGIARVCAGVLAVAFSAQVAMAINICNGGSLYPALAMGTPTVINLAANTTITSTMSTLTVTWSSSSHNPSTSRPYFIFRKDANDVGYFLDGSLIATAASGVPNGDVGTSSFYTEITGNFQNVTSFQMLLPNPNPSSTTASQIFNLRITSPDCVPANAAPVSRAGADQTVQSGAAVTLDGSLSSDADPNTSLGYAWTQTGGTPVTLSNANAVQPTFTAPNLAVGAQAAQLTFQLTVNDRTVSSTADSVAITVQPPQPTAGTAFDAAEEVIREVLTDEATRNLRSVIDSNQRMSRNARERFIQGQLPEAEGVNDVPLDVEGGVDTTDTVISSKGTFFGKTALAAGKSRLVFGDFDVQHDSETGSNTATLNGKVAWEVAISGKTILGYFVGGELARSNIMGGFDGDQNRVGLNVGGYAVHEIAPQTYLDGFFSLGAGRNNLSMTNGVLDLDSDYTTRTATLGAALSAVIEQKGFEIWPELSFSYGRTWLGNVGFTGTAYSMTDNTLNLDAGTVTLANIMFRPEFRVPMDGLSGAESLQLFTFAPRLICEQITTDTVEENCGGGAELGVTAQSENGLSNVSAKLMADRLGDRTSSSLQLNLEHRF